jgi:hypothetical protein
MAQMPRFGVAGIQIDQLVGAHACIRVVQGVQFGGEKVLGPGVAVRFDPALVGMVDVGAVGNRLAQVEVGPEVVGRQALEILAQRARPRRQFRRALAVGEQQRAIAVADVHRPHAFHRVEPGALLDVKADGFQPGLQGGDRRFERGVLAGDEMFGGVHGGELGKGDRQHTRCVKQGIGCPVDSAASIAPIVRGKTVPDSFSRRCLLR